MPGLIRRVEEGGEDLVGEVGTVVDEGGATCTSVNGGGDGRRGELETTGEAAVVAIVDGWSDGWLVGGSY